MTREVIVPYLPRKAFLPFHARTEKEAVLVCHRRAGKTVSIANDGQMRAMTNPRRQPPPRYAWFYPTRVRAKDIAWSYLKYYSRVIPGVKHYEGELAVEYPNGARFTLYGADNSRGVGLYLDGVYYDEADEIPQHVIADVAPALADRGGFAVYAGMLKGRYNLWKRYEANVRNPSVFTMMLRASESGILPADELRRLRNSMGEAAYEMQLECNANASVANAIYGKQMDDLRKSGRLRRVAHAPDAPMCAFFDIGHSLSGDDWSMWLVQMAGRDILVLEYYARTGEIPAHYAAKLREWEEKYGTKLSGVYLPHDGGRQDQQGNTTKSQLEAAGVGRVVVVDRTPNVWDGINHLRALMPRIYINDAGCTQGWTLGETEMPSGVDCLDFYCKKEDVSTGIIRDIPVHNQFSHGADALRTFAEAEAKGLLAGNQHFANFSQRPPPKLAGWNGPRPGERWSSGRVILNR